MTTRSTLLALAEEVESAIPWSLDIDSRIARACGTKFGPVRGGSVEAAVELVPKSIRDETFAMTALMGTGMTCQVTLLWSLGCEATGEHRVLAALGVLKRAIDLGGLP